MFNPMGADPVELDKAHKPKKAQKRKKRPETNYGMPQTHEQGSQSGGTRPLVYVVCESCFMSLMSHKAYDKRQKRLKVMEERGKEPDNGGVTLSELGFKL